MIWDHNRDMLFERAKAVLTTRRAAKYVWGVGFHWYGRDKFENVQRSHDAWPDKKLLFTEGCVEGGPHIGEWEIGERYGRSIIKDLNHWTVGWMDWNLLLDKEGGPNHVRNCCSAPILADTGPAKSLQQLLLLPGPLLAVHPAGGPADRCAPRRATTWRPRPSSTRTAPWPWWS